MFRYSANAHRLPAQLCDQSGKAPLWLPAVSMAAGMTLAIIAPAIAATTDTSQPFKTANIHIETNASACDMGIQMIFDTEGITEGSVEDPTGHVIYSFQASRGMADIGGQTEGFLEGVEPQIVELLGALGCEPSNEEPTIPIQQLFNAWPAGAYGFEGMGDGVTFESDAILSHKIPAGPKITAPEEGTVVPEDKSLVITWKRVTGPILPNLGPVEIIGYHVVVVDRDGPTFPGPLQLQLDIDVAKNVTSVTVPEQYLRQNRVYEFEVLATEKSGNQTISEGLFCTLPKTAANCE
jgi:hypothetical protein